MKYATAATVCTVLALALPALPAAAKPKAQQSGTALTQTDLRTCMGVDGSTHDEQIAACTKIIKSGKVKPPYHGDYYATRGSAYFAKGDLNNALADLNTAIGIRKAAEFYFQRGLVHMSRKSLESAKSDMAEVIKLKPAFAPAYFMSGLIAFTSADYQDALSSFEGAIQRRPTYFQAIYARGVTKKKLGDEAGSKKDIADALGMSPKVGDEMEKLGLKAS
jgi:tetratricopeptide (TPR) repeat protein